MSEIKVWYGTNKFHVQTQNFIMNRQVMNKLIMTWLHEWINGRTGRVNEEKDEGTNKQGTKRTREYLYKNLRIHDLN